MHHTGIISELHHLVCKILKIEPCVEVTEIYESAEMEWVLIAWARVQVADVQYVTNICTPNNTLWL